jgi:signal transduction histidine kinase
VIWPGRTLTAPGSRPTLTGIAARLAVLVGTAAYVVGVYVVVVLGVGALLGVPAPHRPLAVLATAVVAVTLEPVGRALSRLAAPSAYDVLAEFTNQVSGVPAVEDLAPRMARLLAAGTGARRVEVWLQDGSSATHGHLAARWPAEGEAIDEAAVGVVRHDVVHGGERVGWIVREPGRDRGVLTPVEQALLDDLLASSGLALRTLTLAAGLQRRVEESARRSVDVRASRQRIVTAADAARRRLERDIHDGAQQHLVALAVRLRLAATLARRDPTRAARVLDELRGAVASAQQTLEELSRGIHPRALAESGLAAALRAASATSPVRVDVVDALGRRLPHEVESAAYFGCLEAVQNAVKHAGADRVAVRIGESRGAVEIEVRDDGAGFDAEAVQVGSGLRNMRDRIESLGGVLTVESRPGAGTSVVSRIPVAPLDQPVPAGA